MLKHCWIFLLKFRAGSVVLLPYLLAYKKRFFFQISRLKKLYVHLINAYTPPALPPYSRLVMGWISKHSQTFAFCEFSQIIRRSSQRFIMLCARFVSSALLRWWHIVNAVITMKLPVVKLTWTKNIACTIIKVTQKLSVCSTPLCWLKGIFEMWGNILFQCRICILHICSSPLFSLPSIQANAILVTCSTWL